MLSLLQNWKGVVEYEGNEYTLDQFKTVFNNNLDTIHIKLYPNTKKSVTNGHNLVKNDFKVTVKRYMTQKSTPSFDFMAKWNDDNPMPLRTMVGYKVKETPGMVYMKLRGEGINTTTCSRCGKMLTNPISRYYGIGPECMEKLGLVRNIEDIENIKEDLQKIEWEGWVIKSAIIEQCPMV